MGKENFQLKLYENAVTFDWGQGPWKWFKRSKLAE